jgi:hypothetical protein
MCKEQLDAVKEELEAYINGLYPLEKEEVKACLRSALSLHLQVVHQGEPGELLGELVTQAYLERVIPDEPTALAYLLALREPGAEIRAIEGEKRDVARRLVDPSSERGQLHLELLEQVWGQQDGPAGGDDVSLAVRMIQKWGEANDTFDTWAEAELTRVKMQDFIKGMEPVDIGSKRMCSEEQNSLAPRFQFVHGSLPPPWSHKRRRALLRKHLGICSLVEQPQIGSSIECDYLW